MKITGLLKGRVWTKQCVSGGRRGLYVGGIVLSGCLLYAGFVYEPQETKIQVLSGVELYLQLGLFEEARGDLQKFLDREEDDLEGLLWMAYIEESLGRPGVAYNIYANCVDRIEDPDARWATLISMIPNCLKSGRARTAKDLCDTVQEEYGNDPMSLVLRALSYYCLGDDRAFREEFANAWALDPHHEVFTKPLAAVLPDGPRRLRYGMATDEQAVALP